MHWILEPLLFALPFYIANAVPIFAKKIPFLNVPIDAEQTLDGKRILGAHKTIRGFILGVLAGTIVGFLTLNSVFYGFVLSFASLLGDLFGAFLKRRANLQPGEKSIFHDRVFDTIFPILAAYFFDFLTLSPLQLIGLFIFSIYINNIFNWIYFVLKIKEKPW